MSEPGCSEPNIVVVKLGGSVLTGVKAFRRAALFLKSRGEAAPQACYVVVVSAQKGLTDTLALCAVTSRRVKNAGADNRQQIVEFRGQISEVHKIRMFL